MTCDERPYVILQMSTTVDGRIASGPGLTMFDKDTVDALLPDGGPLWERVSRAIEANHQPQAKMMGSRTCVAEGAPLRELPPFEGDPRDLYRDYLPDAVVAGTRTWGILVDGRGRGRGGYKGTEIPGNHMLHLVSESAPPEYLAFLRNEGIPYLVQGKERVDLPLALSKLRSCLGIRALMLWGGGALNGAMLRSQLIDEMHLIVRPVLLGGRETPTLSDCPDPAPGDKVAVLSLQSARTEDHGFLWLHYTVDYKSL